MSKGWFGTDGIRGKAGEGLKCALHRLRIGIISVVDDQQIVRKGTRLHAPGDACVLGESLGDLIEGGVRSEGPARSGKRVFNDRFSQSSDADLSCAERGL